MDQSRTRVAILIDGDNSTSISTASLLAEAEKFGEVTIRRIYGNWSRPSMQKWQELARLYGFEQRHHGQTAPGKNATDIALAIDAMDILYSGTVDHFCLATSDSDYTPLVLRLRSAGCKVLGVGKTTTPLALKAACTVFVSTDQLSSCSAQRPSSTPQLSATPLPTITKTASAPLTVQARGGRTTEEIALPADPLTVLITAYEEAARKEGSEWVRLSTIGIALKQGNAQFHPAIYGHKDLQAFVRAYSDQFETRRQASKGKPVVVRWKRITSPKEPVPSSPLGSVTTSPKSQKRNQAKLSSPPGQTATLAAQKTQPLDEVSLVSLLIQAYKRATEQRSGQWVAIPHLGAVLKQLDPQFKAQVYGYKNLPMLVKHHPGLFLTRKQTAGKTKHTEVQLLTEK